MTTQRQIERQKRALERREANVHYWRAESFKAFNRAIDFHASGDEDSSFSAMETRNACNASVRKAEAECVTLRRKLGITVTEAA